MCCRFDAGPVRCFGAPRLNYIDVDLFARTYFKKKNTAVANEITIKQPQIISKIFSPLVVISTPLQLVSLWFGEILKPSISLAQP